MLAPDDQHLLDLAMTGVAPIRGSGQGAAKPHAALPTSPPLLRPHAAPLQNFLAEGPAPLLDARAVLSFRQAGMQHGVFKHLQQGRYAIEAVLDVRPLRVVQARQALFQFIYDCLAQDLRLLLIKHGKGGHLSDKPPVIKSQVARWLPQFPEVIAFYTAQPRHGGVSAVYVLLRKTEQQRQQTRLSLGLCTEKPG